MHILQSEHTKLKDSEADKLLSELNISKAQLPKIFASDTALPQGSNIGDVIKIKRKDPETGEITPYYRVVI
jgi:DNA-directed RNA polymerase subunit H (RpoH/RPB5)